MHDTAENTTNTHTRTRIRMQSVHLSIVISESMMTYMNVCVFFLLFYLRCGFRESANAQI